MAATSAHRKRLFVVLVSTLAYFLFGCSAFAFDFHDPWGDNQKVLPIGYKSAYRGIQLTPTKFYRVKVTCSARVSSATQISDSLFIRNSRFVSHTLWFSDDPVGLNTIPSTPAAMINVFSFTKDSSGQIVDATNSTCKRTFLISGTASTLTVAYAVNDLKNLSAPGQLIDDVATLLSGMVPLFITGPLQSAIVSDAKGVAGTETPIKDLATAISGTPQKYVRSYALLSGRKQTIISTRYSHVYITITPITDISSQITNDGSLRTSFYKTLDGLSAAYLTGITSANVSNQCGKFADTIQKYYQFSRKDFSFIMGYFAQYAFPGNLDERMSCIGNKNNAQDVVRYDFIYNRSRGPLVRLDEAAIDSHSWDSTDHVLLGQDLANAYLDRLMNVMGTYTQSTTGTAQRESTDALEKWMGDKPVTVQDLTTHFWEDPEVTVLTRALVDKLKSSGFVRFGCFWQRPTVGQGNFDGVFLAFPQKPGNDATVSGEYSLADVIAIRVLLSGTGNRLYPAVVSGVQLTNDYAATFEAANDNHGQCSKAVVVDLQSAKPQTPPTPAPPQHAWRASPFTMAHQ